MKIGFDAKRVFFNNSGLGNYSRAVVELLAKYYPDDNYSLFTPKPDNRSGFVVPNGVECVYPESLLNRKLSSLWRSYNMAGSIRSRGIELFHGLSNELPQDIRSAKIRSVLTMHDIIFIHFPELYKPADRYMYEKKYKRSCRNADSIIAISIQTKEDLVNHWGIAPEKIDVVYQGCHSMFRTVVDQQQRDIIRAKYSLPQDFILSVGTIEERKNLMLSVQAIAEGKIDTHIVACGRHTPYADKVTEYAVSKGIGNRVKFIHNLSFEDLPAIYQMSQVSVYPSIYEGFGIPILEGLCCGVPVITSKGGVFPETGGDAAYYVDPHSTDEMIVALNKTLIDSQLRQDMITRGYAYAENFTDDKVAKNIHTVYSK